MRYQIVINIDYDEATVSDHDELKNVLERNMTRCIDRHNLLVDGEYETVIDQYSAEVIRVAK